MLNRSNAQHSSLRIAALVIVAVLIGLVTKPARSPAVKPPQPLSPGELELVGTWAYPADQSGKSIVITFSKDRIYTYPSSDLFVHPAHWRIDGTNLIIEQKIKTVVGGPPALPIPDAVRRLQLPEFMWHIEKTTQAISFSDSGGLQLSGVWPACTLTRCEAPEATLVPDKGITKP